MAAAAEDWALATVYTTDAVTHLIRAVERMANWSPEAQAWIPSALAEARGLAGRAAKR
jgi:hypothetical protein